MNKQTKIENLTIADSSNSSMLLIIHLFILVMFTAKIFKVNDLSWWIIFSPYLVALAIYILAILFKSIARKEKRDWSKEFPK